MSGSVIVSTARTPIGKLSGALAGFSAMDLGGVAITAALIFSFAVSAKPIVFPSSVSSPPFMVSVYTTCSVLKQDPSPITRKPR